MRLLWKTVAVLTVLFLVIANSRIQAVADEVPRSWAIVTLTGSATINNAPAVSGQTLFSKNTIVTTKSSSLTIDVRAARLEVKEQTELKVDVLADGLRAELNTGYLSFATRQGITTVDLLPGLSIVSDPTLPSRFTVAAKDSDFEVRVAEGAVDVVDSRETSRQVTHVGPNMRFSNSGLHEIDNDQSNLTTRQRATIFIVAGVALAVLFAVIVTSNKQVTDGFGGCVVVSGSSC